MNAIQKAAVEIPKYGLWKVLMKMRFYAVHVVTNYLFLHIYRVNRSVLSVLLRLILAVAYIDIYILKLKKTCIPLAGVHVFY